MSGLTDVENAYVEYCRTHGGSIVSGIAGFRAGYEVAAALSAATASPAERESEGSRDAIDPLPPQTGMAASPVDAGLDVGGIPLTDKLRDAKNWLNGGKCCGQVDSAGVCFAPACIFGEACKWMFDAADEIDRQAELRHQAAAGAVPDDEAATGMREWLLRRNSILSAQAAGPESGSTGVWTHQDPSPPSPLLGLSGIGREEIARAAEAIILRRQYRNRIDGYTLEMGVEIADAILALQGVSS